MRASGIGLALIALSLVLYAGAGVAFTAGNALSVTAGGGGGCPDGTTILTLTPTLVTGTACSPTGNGLQSGNTVYIWVTDGGGSQVLSTTNTTQDAGAWSLSMNLGQGTFTVTTSLCPPDAQPCDTPNAIGSFTYVVGKSVTFTATTTISTTTTTSTTTNGGPGGPAQKYTMLGALLALTATVTLIGGVLTLRPR